MWIIETIVVAFSMFSALPMPQIEWTEKNMRYALCAFPLIGAVIGLICWLWSLLGTALHLPALLMGAVWCLIPLLVTGGIHMDGFCDTWDALSSHADTARKHEILKDPHLGAFGAIRLGMYLVISFALWTSLKSYRPVPVLLGFCLSRSLSGLAVTRFPLAGNTGLAHTFAHAADKKRAGTMLLILSVILTAGLCLFGWAGAGMAVAAWSVFAYYYHMAKKQFGGLSGDLAGWFLQTAELWMLAALCIIPYVEAIL